MMNINHLSDMVGHRSNTISIYALDLVRESLRGDILEAK